ncbi:MAG: hypothetical protein AB8B80_15810 [Marinicellaceae bacterium]
MNKKDPIKSALDQHSSKLDQKIVSQLDEIREKAISNNNKTHWYNRVSWHLLGPAVAAMVLVVVFMSTNRNPVVDTQTDSFLNDLDLLSHEIDVELLEDLEFIAWLDSENILEGDLL